MPQAMIERIAQAIIATGREPWQAAAACAGRAGLMDHTCAPHVWSALHVCQGCPVIEQCRQWVEGERDYVGVAAGKVYRTTRVQGRTVRIQMQHHMQHQKDGA